MEELYERDDQEAMGWYENWLKQRKNILANNIMEATGSQYNHQNGKNINLNWRPGYRPSEKIVDSVLDTQINNMKNAPYIRDWDHFVSLTNNLSKTFDNMQNEDYSNTLGMYHSALHAVSYNPNTKYAPTTAVHERTHAAKPTPQVEKIQSILGNEYGEDYWHNPEEILARRNEFNKELNIQPNQKIDQEFLNNNRENLREFYLDTIRDEHLLPIFNEVAQNKIPQNKYASYARKGIKLIPKKFKYGRRI